MKNSINYAFGSGLYFLWIIGGNRIVSVLFYVLSLVLSLNSLSVLDIIDDRLVSTMAIFPCIFLGKYLWKFKLENGEDVSNLMLKLSVFSFFVAFVGFIIALSFKFFGLDGYGPGWYYLTTIVLFSITIFIENRRGKRIEMIKPWD